MRITAKKRKEPGPDFTVRFYRAARHLNPTKLFNQATGFSRLKPELDKNHLKYPESRAWTGAVSAAGGFGASFFTTAPAAYDWKYTALVESGVFERHAEGPAGWTYAGAIAATVLGSWLLGMQANSLYKTGELRNRELPPPESKKSIPKFN